ncbi:related to Probable 2-oxoglutarate dehydrogenase E1 component DHKTD1 homolog, mitochondrial [Armillaria ostoyae]|uniref:Related to Probable 2-oxoglutarate dehydrogenase E1 component DHKTD1 homolog, mitochondrial n=1 Tax=Armillaria ostoyae TaxID=47428 RepID=A0A284R3M6_ARMOS|nr:related to Probable 2-oxoglutarate dehydrogenase E1 component DHKTD1 homolog, mitochondrial [Armillaria ostoyae]
MHSLRRLRLQQQSSLRRLYHDESFGYRKPRPFIFPDYTPSQLENRAHNAALLRYVDSVRTHGHRAARIDPLDLIHRKEVAALDPSRYGITDESKKYNVNGIIWTHPSVESQGENITEEWWTLGEIVRHLRSIYVNRIAYEYMHSPSKSERLWFSHRLESKSTPTTLDADTKKRIHGLLARSEVFDNFMQVKFPNLKRYGLEGGESMLPALDSLFSSAAQADVSHIVLAMPHRGRLNLLTDLLNYNPTALFHKVRGGAEIPEGLGAEGDVISHLEAVAGVALGKARAKQYSLLKTSAEDCKLGDRVMCVQLHGDASFTGQGVVMESLGLSNLPHFTSGGTVHLVVDNNIGYTTPASQARSSLYCSDVGKMINTPVLHVNGDYPEDVVKAMEVAFQYRQYFRKDIIVDLLVYRRCHNELDLPNLTSPLMYDKIQSRLSVPQLYEQKLVNEQTLTTEDIANVREQHKSNLNDKLDKVPSYVPSASMLKEQWAGMVWPISKGAVQSPDTGVDKDILIRVGKASVQVPQGFEIHPKLQRHIKNRLASLESGKGLDWATAEALAFGSLLLEGYDVRISGQDVGRGTFSQRHAMLVNQKNENTVVPLNDELSAPGKLELANSSLSEMAVLSFEYGASWERPDLLPIWEAQFGDFFNGAQIIIDTFISSSESKWLKQSGIVMLLPHGLDGAGPEHSSSRIERMLQLSNDRYTYEEDPSFNINMHVVFPTTPAQYFHLLRRQMKRNYRKPLIVAGPKGLLRLSPAASSLSDLETRTSFRPVLADPYDNASTASRIIILSGKIYYDLLKERQARGLDANIALVRLEELSPFPFAELATVLEGYTSAREFFYLQEEPRNQGAFGHVKERIMWVLKEMVGAGDVELVYKGRKESPLPAPGIGKLYQAQQRTVLESAFEGF